MCRVYVVSDPPRGCLPCREAESLAAVAQAKDHLLLLRHKMYRAKANDRRPATAPTTRGLASSGSTPGASTPGSAHDSAASPSPPNSGTTEHVHVSEDGLHALDLDDTP